MGALRFSRATLSHIEGDYKNYQSLSLWHRREYGVEKGEEPKTALLLIHDQEKVNMAKKQNRQDVYS